MRQQRERIDRLDGRLRLLDPAQVLQRGYAWLVDAQGRAVTSTARIAGGDAVSAQLADGSLDLHVDAVHTRSPPTPGA
jgi:exodeoxyribonuclease VII large subunit